MTIRTLSVLTGCLLVASLAGSLEAQAPDSTVCADRIGPSMQALHTVPEPIFTNPSDPATEVSDAALVHLWPPGIYRRLR